MLAQDAADGNAVGAAQRVVAHKGAALSVGAGGQVVKTVHFYFNVQFHKGFAQPGHALHGAHASQKGVEFVLVYDAFEPVAHKTRNVTSLAAGFGAQHCVDVKL